MSDFDMIEAGESDAMNALDEPDHDCIPNPLPERNKMTDIQTWINEARVLVAGATEGGWFVTEEWEEQPDGCRTPIEYLVNSVNGDEIPHFRDGFRRGDAAFIADARTRLPQALDALQSVLDKHQDGGRSQGYVEGGYGVMEHACTECGTLGEYGVEWPCRTVETIRDALGIDEDDE